MKTTSLGFIGGGRITGILLQAFANKMVEFKSVVVFDTNAEVLAALKGQYPKIVVAETAQQAAGLPIVFLALHPPVMMESLGQIAEAVSADAAVISLAPKITIEKMASKLKTQNIGRLIPNATSYINEGYNPVSFSSGFHESRKAEILELLKILGTTIEVQERKLEAYAILSAMLPTYFWFQWKELIAIGDLMELTEAESRAAVQQTLAAAMNLYFESGLSPEQVMDLVPVKPIGDYQGQITEIYQTKLLGLFEKIRPQM